MSDRVLTHLSPVPEPFDICDEHDKVIESVPGIDARRLKILAKRIATQRQAIVYYYGDNGREAVEPSPTVGCPATICYYTDRKAATMIAVSPNGRKVTVREDKATRTDTNGMSESQTYTYEPDPEGKVHVFYRRGDWYKTAGTSLVLGRRRSYHDYSY